MSVQISDRAAGIKPSPTLSVSARATALKAAGKNIISLAAGEPDFDTPDFVKQAAIKAIQDGFTKYTAVDGTPALKKAVIAKFKRENGLEYGSNQILVSCGCKHSIYNLMMAVLNPGDEVIIPGPYWTSYPDMAKLAGAEPIVIPTSHKDQFKITPAQLRAALSAKSRMFIMNSPSNPTGEHYSTEELAALGAEIKSRPDILVASDDIYEHILWTGEAFSNIVNACPDLYPQTVILNGVSKAYAMTGWRIGYAAGPAAIIQAMNNLQSQSTSNPTSIAQVAAQAALEGDQQLVKERCNVFRERHDYVVARLNGIEGVECIAGKGTFYAFPSMQAAMESTDGVSDDIQFAEYILERAEVAMVPGSAFGAPGYMRLSFATSMDNLKGALDRLETLLGKR